MMSISNVSAGAAASGYYKEEGYYKAGSDEAKNATQWFGKAAEAEGLTGHVDDKRFAELLEGQAPDGKLMGRYVDGERQHRPGLDLTFSASKTASIAALVVGDTRVIEAHDKAVRAAMEVVEERFAKTRIQKNGEIVTTDAKGIIAGIYRHDTSRALDPNLHSHAVIANMVKNENGTYTALTNEAVFRNRKLITEVYRSSFESSMKEMGISTERGKYGEVNLTAIPQHVADQFSTRRKEIIAALDAKGIEYSADTAAKATLATRAAKHKELDRATLRAEWRNDAQSFGLSQEMIERGEIGHLAEGKGQDRDNSALRARPAERPAPGPQSQDRFATLKSWIGMLIRGVKTDRIDPVTDRRAPEATAVSRAIAHVSERASVYERSALTAAALRLSEGVSLKEIDHEIERRIEGGEIFAKGKHGQTLTDRVTLAREQEIIRAWRHSERAPGLNLRPGRTHPGISDLQARLDREPTLTNGQRDAIETALSGSGRYVQVQGYAGTGKTFMATKLTELAGEAGYEVKGFAPTHQAVRELAAVTGEARTLASVLTQERTHPQQVDNSRSILLVDEASMISSRDMATLMYYAHRTNAARVVLLGDMKQLDAVSAGQPFAQLQEAGMRMAVMDDIQRQKETGLRAAVYDAVRGDIGSAFDRLSERVTQSEDPRQAAAQDYLNRDAETRAGTRVLTLTNAARAEITETIRDGLKAEGTIGQADTQITALSIHNQTDAERRYAGSYAVGDIVQSRFSYADHGLENSVLYTVTATDQTRNTITLETARGEETAEPIRVTLSLDATHRGRPIAPTLVTYREETRALVEGDLIRARITDAARDITNGDRGQVMAITDEQVTLKLNDGRELEIPTNSLGARGIEHDYAATAHAVQGESSPHVIVAMNAREALATQKAFYVQISRAQNSATLHTDHPTQLARNIADNTGARVTALETRIAGALERSTPEAIKAVTWAVDHMSERSSSWARADLEVTALQRMADPNPDAILNEIDRRIAEGSLFNVGNTMTDKASVALESSILMTFHAAKSKPGVVLTNYEGRSAESTLATKLAAGNSLTDGQKDAITTSLTGEGRYVGVQGFAGTGKTFMLERMAHYAAQSGYEVKGYAPSHQAVQELSSVLGKAETLASLLTTERNDPQDIDNSRAILVVDESSMIGAKDMRSFMDYAERTNVARVVFVGDTQQLDAVAAGQPFDQLQDAGMRTAIMDEIRRQRDTDLRDAVSQSIRGNILAAFEKLGENVREAEHPVEEAAKAWLTLSDKDRSGARVITLTNDARKEASAYIRAALKDEGKVHGREVEIAALQTSQMTEAQLTDARSYKVGQRVLSMVNSRTHGLEKHGVYVVTAKDPEHNSIMVRHETEGTEHLLPLSSSFNRRELGKSLVAYEVEERKIARGDAIRFRITDKDAGITNGQRATITATTGRIIGVEMQDGSTITLRTDTLAARGIEHDYAATAHAVQGASISHPIVVMHESERLSHQKSFYVDISRAVDKATLITDDAAKLQERIEKETGERSTALEAWLESQRASENDRAPKTDQGSDRPQEQERGNNEAEKSRDHDKANPERAHSPDAIDPKLEERIKEMEQVVERMRSRQKEIVR